MRSRYQERLPLTGLIVGAISGLAGTVVMTQFQNVWNKISEDIHKPRTEHEAKPAEEQKEELDNEGGGQNLRGNWALCLVRSERKWDPGFITPCPRCVMTTLSQADLPKDNGILRTAAQHNRANVGVYASVLQGGEVGRGDSLGLE